MLKQLSGSKVIFERFYTGEMNVQIDMNEYGVHGILFEWDYNPHELDEDMLKLMMLNNTHRKIKVFTPYVPYLRSDKMLKKNTVMNEYPMIDLIRTNCQNITFIAPPQHNELGNIQVNEDFEEFEKLCETHLIVAGDSSEYERLKERGVDCIETRKERTSDGIRHVIIDPERLLQTSHKPICIKDDLLSYGSTVVSLCEDIEDASRYLKKVDTVCVEFADGLHEVNDDFPDVEVVALNQMQHQGFLK